MTPRRAALEKLLHDVFELTRGPSDEQQGHDFVFHMVDAEEDVMAVGRLLSDPENYTLDQARQIVNGFLLHAVGHATAAARLYGGFLDPFAPQAPEP